MMTSIDLVIKQQSRTSEVVDECTSLQSLCDICNIQTSETFSGCSTGTLSLKKMCDAEFRAKTSSRGPVFGRFTQ